MKKILLILIMLFPVVGFSQQLFWEQIRPISAQLQKTIPELNDLILIQDSSVAVGSGDKKNVTIEGLREGFNPYPYIRMDTGYVETGNEPKGTEFWDEKHRTITLVLGNGVKLQVGQESLVHIYNATSDTLKDQRIIGFGGVSNGKISAVYASKDERHTFFGATTEDVAPADSGLAVNLSGAIHGASTGSLVAGLPFYCDTMGYLTNTRPEFPDYIYPLGTVLKEGDGDGIIFFRSDGINYKSSILDAFDGQIRESFDFRTFSDGIKVYGVLSNPTGADKLTLMFGSGWFDFSVPDTIQLPVGTIDDEQESYVYIDETLTMKVSTSNFPTTEHAKVAIIDLLDAETTQQYEALGNQNINDHLKSNDDNGHILHMSERIRAMDSEWARTGLAVSLSGTPTNGYLTMTGGKLWQMHKQTLEPIDMTSGDIVWVINDPDTTWKHTDNLNYITKFSDGSAWNNMWGKIVVWVIGNKTGEKSHLVVNLPSNGYLSEENAINDADNYANYNIPDNFKSKAILLRSFVIRISPAGITYNPSTGDSDLRGKIANNIAGGGGGASGVTDYTQLNQTPSSLEALAFQRVDETGTSLENVLADSILLTEFDSTGFTLEQSQIAGLVDSITIALDHVANDNDLDSFNEIQTLSSTGGAINLSKGGGSLTLYRTDPIVITTLPDGFNFSHSSSAGYKHVPSGGTNGNVLLYGGSSGTALWGQDYNLWNDAYDSIPALRADINELDISKQDTFNLTTTGTSGASTFDGTTLNVPNYVAGLTNGYIPYFTTQLVNSPIYTTGTNVMIGTTTDNGYKLDVNGAGIFRDDLEVTNTGVNAILKVNRTDGAQGLIQAGGTGWKIGTTNNNPLYFVYNGVGNVGASLFTSGNFGIGTTTDNGYKLDVNGTGIFRDDLVIDGLTTVNATGSGSSLIVNRTDGDVVSLQAGSSVGRIMYDDSGEFQLMSATRSNIVNGIGIGTVAFSIDGNTTDGAFYAGLTVADAPILNNDVIRKIDLEDASLDVDFNSIAINTVDINQIISDSTQTAKIDTIIYSSDTLNVVEGGISHKVEIPQMIDSYINSVTESSNSITFGSVGSAFSGSVGSIAKTDISQSFQATNQTGTVLSILNTANAIYGDADGLIVRTYGQTGSNVVGRFQAGVSAQNILSIYGDGDIQMPYLPSGKQAKAVYISGGYLYEGDTISGSIDLSYSGTSSPVTLNSSSGNDVTITAGTGISLSATSSNLTINSTASGQIETMYQSLANTGEYWINLYSSALSSTITGTSANVTLMFYTNSNAYYGQGSYIVAGTYNGGTRQANIITLGTSSPSGVSVTAEILSSYPTVKITNNSGQTLKIVANYYYGSNVD